MVSLNKVMIAGQLTKKPELRKTNKGSSVTDLLLAINRDYTNPKGVKQKEVCFVDVIVWGKQAEVCVAHLDCSSLILVEGRLQLDTWESNGERRTRLRVTAERIQFLDKKKKDDFKDDFKYDSKEFIECDDIPDDKAFSDESLESLSGHLD